MCCETKAWMFREPRISGWRRSIGWNSSMGESMGEREELRVELAYRKHRYGSNR